MKTFELSDGATTILLDAGGNEIGFDKHAFAKSMAGTVNQSNKYQKIAEIAYTIGKKENWNTKTTFEMLSNPDQLLKTIN